MGAELLATEPVFAATVAQAEPLIAGEAGFSVTNAMSAPQIVTGIDRIQPTLFTMQVALAATMKSYGVRPGAVIGHSLGEAAAAVVAGALSLEDGIRLICRRSRLMSRISGAGAMASVELPAQQVLSELMARGVSDVVVAVVASPQSTVIGGATETVRELVAAWEERDVMAREVAVDVASHSPQVDPILDDLTGVLAELKPQKPEVPFYSATLFDPREPVVCDARYWVDNLRNMVRFSAAVQAALEDGYRVFAELSPHPLLTHPLDQTARSLDIRSVALASVRREQELPNGLRNFLIDLHSAGAAIDFSVLYPAGQLVDAPLPSWTHRELRLTPGEDTSTRAGSTISVHPLLGPHVRLQEEPERHVWQADVGTDAQPWLEDHQIRNVSVLPGAAYCEMALAAARSVLGEASEVRDLRFESALLLDGETLVGASASVASPDVLNFQVETNQGGEQSRQAAGVLHVASDEQPAAYDIAALLAAHPREEDGEEVRKGLDARGVQYGPAFTGLGALHLVEGESEVGNTVLAEVVLPSQIRTQQSAYGVHPALLDAAFQSVGAHAEVRALGEDALALPLSVHRLRSYTPARTRSTATRVSPRSTLPGSSPTSRSSTSKGQFYSACKGCDSVPVSPQSGRDARILAERLLTVEWRHRELPEVDQAEAGNWLLVTTTDTADVVATTLTDTLKAHGAQCTTMCWPMHADHVATVEELKKHLSSTDFTGVAILTGPKNGDCRRPVTAAGARLRAASCAHYP